MANVNDLIRERLRRYPKDVEEVALKALELSESQSEPAVADYLRSLVRDIIKRSAVQE